VSAREIALAVVRDVFPPSGSSAPERGAQESLDYRTRQAQADSRDRAFATELAYGSIKMRRALDWHLAPFIGERAQTLPAVVREILRLAIFELAYTQPDAHATVFEFVNLAKRFGHRGLANLVNAVLRSFLREPSAPPQPQLFETPDEYLGTRYSLPTWLARQWRDVFGDYAEAVCSAVNDPARIALTVNTLRETRESVAERLRESGVVTSPSALARESLLVDSGGGSLRALEPEARGAWWTQSESSAVVAGVLDPRPGEAILDVCSGRGNKALQIGARLSGDGKLACLERDARKAAVLARRLEDAGVAGEIVVGDATAEAPEQRDFDRALIDAPCSGVGVVGRHPEARWKKQGTDGERLALTQRALLDRTARRVRAGGTLVYAVCSSDSRETTEVVQWFLSRENFERGSIPAAYEAFSTVAGEVLIPPGMGGRDGFFIARLERR
jgi:16S rRNA (cytosine967-C5)-methyltransferase